MMRMRFAIIGAVRSVFSPGKSSLISDPSPLPDVRIALLPLRVDYDPRRVVNYSVIRGEDHPCKRVLPLTAPPSIPSAQPLYQSTLAIVGQKMWL